MSRSATVAVRRTSPQSVMEDVRAAMELADWRRRFSRNGAVALKVNLGWDKLIPGAISAPWVVEGVVRVVKDYSRRLYLVESDQVVVDVERAFRLAGMDNLCRRHGVEWVNMSRGRFIRVRDDTCHVLKEVLVPEILTRTELMTVPVMKTHNKTVISGAVKNQWGCLPMLRHTYHLVLAKALAELHASLRPRFAVMDGTIGLEGNGPKSGIPKEMNLILASSDSVAIDTVAAHIMGFSPEEIEHLQMCASAGLGVAELSKIQVVGDGIHEVGQRFRLARHNLISRGELLLRQSAVRRLVFDTSAFRLFCWVTRRYYDCWDLFVGRRLRRAVFEASDYAPQWQGALPR